MIQNALLKQIYYEWKLLNFQNIVIKKTESVYHIESHQPCKKLTCISNLRISLSIISTHIESLCVIEDAFLKTSNLNLSIELKNIALFIQLISSLIYPVSLQLDFESNLILIRKCQIVSKNTNFAPSFLLNFISHHGNRIKDAFEIIMSTKCSTNKIHALANHIFESYRLSYSQ